MTIMSLEQILLDLEQGKGPVRDPERYFLTIFGKPSNQGKWGWRVEGHHLSLNFTLENGKVVSATPAFFGANPAEVRKGPREGLRTLADVEDRALRLVQALTPDQIKVAVVEPTAPKDIRAANTPQPPTEAAVGIAYKDLTEDQRELARALVESYAADMPAEVGRALDRRDPRSRRERRQVRLVRSHRSKPRPRLPRPGTDIPDRVQ